jgi:hypothetical protein
MTILALVVAIALAFPVLVWAAGSVISGRVLR